MEASWAGGGRTVAGARPYKLGETSELECAEVQTACPTGGRLPGRGERGVSPGPCGLYHRLPASVRGVVGVKAV